MNGDDGLHEEVMRVEFIDIINNDHGGASLDVRLATPGAGQSFILAPTPERLYQILCLFNVEQLRAAQGKPIIALRKKEYGYIEGLRRLPCDPPMEVLR